MATYAATFPFGSGTVKVDFDGLSLCDFHLLSKNIEDFIAKRVSQSLGPMRPLEPEERPAIAMTSWHTPPIGELDAPFEETTPIPPNAMIAASTEIAGMDRYNNCFLKGYPLSADDSKFDTPHEAIQAFRTCIKKGIKVGGITFQKCRNKWIWSIRSSKTPKRERPTSSKVDTTYSWIPRCFEEYEQQCKQEVEPPCYDGSDGRVSYNSLEDEDEDEEVIVKEIEIDGIMYYHCEDDNRLYDGDSCEAIGFYKDGKIV